MYNTKSTSSPSLSNTKENKCYSTSCVRLFCSLLELKMTRGLDLRLTKIIGLGADRRLELFLEMFNVPNFVHEVLDLYDIPATFFVSGVADLVDPQMVPTIVNRKRHEIGVLGWSDENVATLNDAGEEERLLSRAIERMTSVAGRKPVGARGPSGTMSLHTMGLLKKAGILYDSTLQSRDEAYEVLLEGQRSAIVELPNNVYRNDYRFLTAARTGPGLLPSPELIFETFRDDFDVAYQEGTLFVLTLHPQVVGMRSRIIYLDELVHYIKQKPGVWFATAEQIARYVKQQAGLSD